MTNEQKQILLEEFTAQKSTAINGGVPNIQEVQKIVLKLNNLPNSDKVFLKDFVLNLKNELFDAGATLQGLNISSFESEQIIADTNETIEEQKAELINRSYQELLTSILQSLKEEIPSLKNYFFLRLHSNNDNNYQPLLIYEDGCFFKHVHKRLKDDFPVGYTFLSIKEIDSQISQNLFPLNNYVVTLLLSSRINEPEKLSQREESLNNIFNYFDDTFHLQLKKLESIKNGDILISSNREELLDEIKCVTSCILTNSEITNDEEKIIKMLFKDSSCPILEYTILKGGKSGSKVIEVLLKNGYATNKAKRYIVKFSSDGKRKIKVEAERFGEHVEHFAIKGYEKSYKSNPIAEGIRYTYASDNTIAKSFSFSKILGDEKNKFHTDKIAIVSEVFNSPPFELWHQSCEEKKIKVIDLYFDYINTDKFRRVVQQIKGIDESLIENEKLIICYDKICQFEFNTFTKVCHGDFHSENFFKDETGEIYLIDFGFTKVQHALIDHTTLECSMKFKHVPFYIDLQFLEEIEKQLILTDSFTHSFSIKTSRQDILEYYNIIKEIRLNSKKYYHNQNSNVEYLISLFVLTCRQIQYNDLNQLYALKSAEILGEKIVQLIT